MVVCLVCASRGRGWSYTLCVDSTDPFAINAPQKYAKTSPVPMSPDRHSQAPPRATHARTQRPSPTPFESFGRRAPGRTSSQWALAPVDFVALSARAGSLRRVGVVPMTMPLSRPTLYPSTVRAALVVFTGRTPIPVLIVHVLSFQTYLSALLPLAPLPVEPLPRIT